MKPPFRLASASIVAISLLAGTALCSSAQATPVAFSFNYSYGGGSTQSYTPGGVGSLLSNATTVTEGTDQYILTTKSIFGPTAGNLNDPINYVAAPLVVPSAESGALTDPLSIHWGSGNVYSFTAFSGTYTRVPLQDALTFAWTGTFTDSSGALNTQGATLSQTWSQAAPDITPSTGGTFNTNPGIPVPVPEPGAFGVLAVGLLGLGLVRRRRRPEA